MKAYKLTPDEWALVNLARRYNLDPQKVLAVAIDKLIAVPGVMAFEIEVLTDWERGQRMCKSMPLTECFKYETCGAGCPVDKLRKGEN